MNENLFLCRRADFSWPIIFFYSLHFCVLDSFFFASSSAHTQLTVSHNTTKKKSVAKKIATSSSEVRKRRRKNKIKQKLALSVYQPAKQWEESIRILFCSLFSPFSLFFPSLFLSLFKHLVPSLCRPIPALFANLIEYRILGMNFFSSVTLDDNWSENYPFSLHLLFSLHLGRVTLCVISLFWVGRLSKWTIWMRIIRHREAKPACQLHTIGKFNEL